MRALTHCCVFITAALVTLVALNQAQPPSVSTAPISASAAEQALGDYRLEQDLRGSNLRAGSIISVRKESSQYVIDGLHLDDAMGRAPIKLSFAFGANGQATALTLTRGSVSAQAQKLSSVL